MTVDLNTDKQDYPQPSDLSTFVNETKFSSPTEGMLYTGLSASSRCYIYWERGFGSFKEVGIYFAECKRYYLGTLKNDALWSSLGNLAILGS